MINKSKKSFFVVTLFFSLLVVGSLMLIPNLGLADETDTTGPRKPLIENPLGTAIKDIPTLINKVLEIVVTIGLPIVALAFIYVGFLFVAAQGSEDKLTAAKEAFLYTVIGAAIVLGAFVISKAIKATVDEIKGPSTAVPSYFIDVAFATHLPPPFAPEAGHEGEMGPPAPDSGAVAADSSTIGSIINTIIVGNILKAMVGLIFAASLVAFLLGVMKYMRKAGEDEAREEAKKLIIYGIIGLAVMVSVWGLVNVVVKTFFPEGQPPSAPIPRF